VALTREKEETKQEFERTIAVSPERIPKIFGFQDENLRTVLKVLPVRVVAMNDEIRIVGGSEQTVQQAFELFSELNRISAGRREITAQEIDQLLNAGTATIKEPNQLDESIPVRTVRRSGGITPRTRGQETYLQAITENDLVFCSGPAGSGKTYLAVAKALEALHREQVRKLVLVRPAVEAGEKLGFLPGDLIAKVNPFLRPLLDALRDMLDFETVQRYLDHDVIEIVPLAFMRGRTLNETFIILDEAQNTTITQMKMFLTRMGNGSKIVVTGDETQNDLPENVTSGLTDAVRRLNGISGSSIVRLTGQDIVRHRLVREIVKAYDS